MTAPLIVTLAFDAASRDRFQAARDAWFPPERNVVPAHMTLFHHLPGERAPEVAARLAAVAAARAPIPVRVSGVMSLGRGAAYRIEAEGIARLRAEIAAGFELTDQDRAPARPHVTVQNKVGKDEARTCVEALRAGFAPWDGAATGLELWRYRGGPWEEAGRFDFAVGDREKRAD
jgi:2'-5' RNA ligase